MILSCNLLFMKLDSNYNYNITTQKYNQDIRDSINVSTALTNLLL